MRTLSIRLDDELADAAALAAEIEGSSTVAVIRDALTPSPAARRNDPAFQRSLQASNAKWDAMLARFGKSPHSHR
jgi:predicted transcriptional regulator